MDIDLSLLHSNTINEIDISGVYNLDKNYYENCDITNLENINVNGKIIRREDEDGEFLDYMICKINGVMIIPDSITLENIEYPYEIEYDDYLEDNCKKNENILDIFQLLWENIVLEVPLQFTKVSDLSKFHGDGWRLISEDELVKNNPFSDLLKDYNEEE